MDYPIITKRLSIQPLSLEDLVAFVEYRQDPKVARFQSWEETYSTDQGRKLIESQVGVLFPKPGDWLQLAIRKRGSLELVGDLALHAISEDNSEFELGFTISAKLQGQGFAKEAASSLISYLFNSVGAKKLIAHTDSRNEASVRLLKSLGFTMLAQRGWIEEFKNEMVRVEYFELNQAPSPKSERLLAP